MKNVPVILKVSVALLCSLVATSCSTATGSTKMSEKDKANFKGGPMPPEARVEMMKRMQAANVSAPASNKPK